MSIHLLQRVINALAVCAFLAAACQAPVSPTLSIPPISATVTATTPSAAIDAMLVPADSDAPAAGICAEAEGEWATVQIAPDMPSPRCLKVTREQRLKVINGADTRVQIQLGPYALELPPGMEGTLDAPFGNFLAPGVHRVLASPYSGPEVWLIEDLSTPAPSAVRTWPADAAHLGTPGSDFALRFSPEVWTLTPFREDLPGLEALEHRSLAGCRIIPNIPVGFASDWTTEEGQVALGGRTLQTRRVSYQAELKFVVYAGFLDGPYEGSLEVHFEGNAEACLHAAEGLFASTEVIRLDPMP